MKHSLLVILLLPLALVAQQYTLDELIEHGLKHSWTMQRSTLSYQSSASNLSTARWNLLPDADLGFKAGYDLHNTAVPKVSDLSSSAGITISKNVSLNDASWFNYRFATLDESKARLELERSATGYAYEVFSAYLAVLSAQKQLASLTENLAIQTRVWEQSKVLLQLGKVTSFEVKQNEIAVMNSNISIIKLQNTISTNRQKLFGLVLVDDQGFELADLEPDKDFLLPEPDTEQISEVQLLKADIKRSELSQTQDWLNYFPRVNLAYNFSRNVGGEDFDFDRYTTSHTVSLNLSYSLWNHFKQSQSAKRANFSLRLAELNLNDRIDEINRQYRILKQELEYLQRLDQLYEEKLNQSRQQIRIAEERYRLGLIELLELDKTRTDYIDADIAFNTNRYDIIAKQQAINYLLSRSLLGKW